MNVILYINEYKNIRYYGIFKNLEHTHSYFNSIQERHSLTIWLHIIK